MRDMVVHLDAVTFEPQSYYAEIGYLLDFAWRSKHVDTDDGVDGRLLQEYRGITQKYKRKEVLHRMSTQVESIARELMTAHRKAWETGVVVEENRLSFP